MPELPEIEHLRRTLEPWLVGARVARVDLRRRDVVRVAGSRAALRGVKPQALLQGDRIVELVRRGKSLAIVGDSGRVLVAHMGMSGAMMVGEADAAHARDKHEHCVWEMLRDAGRRGARTRGSMSSTHPPADPLPQGRGKLFRLIFRDPRRFGGLWPFESMDDLLTRAGGWARLGPDALEPPLDGDTLRERLLRTRQPMKAALLNQRLIAGVGNIYADESLFAAGIHPLTRPGQVDAEQWQRLAEAIRAIMLAAVGSGGSTIRSYRDATGREGAFAFEHRVYGRGGEACVTCRETLRSRAIGQRTSVFCEVCQARPGTARAARKRDGSRRVQRRTSVLELCTADSGHNR